MLVMHDSGVCPSDLYHTPILKILLFYQKNFLKNFYVFKIAKPLDFTRGMYPCNIDRGSDLISFLKN